MPVSGLCRRHPLVVLSFSLPPLFSLTLSRSFFYRSLSVIRRIPKSTRENAYFERFSTRHFLLVDSEFLLIFSGNETFRRNFVSESYSRIETRKHFASSAIAVQEKRFHDRGISNFLLFTEIFLGSFKFHPENFKNQYLFSPKNLKLS